VGYQDGDPWRGWVSGGRPVTYDDWKTRCPCPDCGDAYRCICEATVEDKLCETCCGVGFIPFEPSDGGIIMADCPECSGGDGEGPVAA
jgi:hypothetical protein